MLIPFNSQHTHSTSYKDIQMITQAQLKSILDYDQDTGLFTWKKKLSNRTEIGNLAGYYKDFKYTQICIEGTLYYAHRLVWLYMYGYMPKYVDHINKNKSDNRLCNLREATNQQNAFNSKKPSNNTSGIKGVMWNKYAKKWHVQLCFNKKKKHIGYYADFFEACCISIKTRNLMHGEFANFC